MFECTAEHPNGKHIEENMLEVGMHEHISYQLGQIEIRCKKKMQAERIVQVNAVFLGNHIPKKAQHIYNKQVFRNRR